MKSLFRLLTLITTLVTGLFVEHSSTILGLGMLVPTLAILVVMFVLYVLVEIRLPEDNPHSDSQIRNISSGVTTIFFRRLTRNQVILLSIVLMFFSILLILLIGSWVRDELPLMWQFFPFFYAIGPFAYAVFNRRLIAGPVHFMIQITTGSVSLPGTGEDGHFLIALVSAVVMEIVLTLSDSEESKLWRCVAAVTFSVALSWGVLTYIDAGWIDPLQIAGGAFVGAIAYYASEVVWGGRKAIKNQTGY